MLHNQRQHYGGKVHTYHVAVGTANDVNEAFPPPASEITLVTKPKTAMGASV